MTIRSMRVPQSRHGSPARPYTRSLRRKLPGWPWKLRKSRNVVPPCLTARRSTCLARRRHVVQRGVVQVARPRERMHAGQEQGFVGVDVAQPGGHALVQQHALERRAAPAHPPQPVVRPDGQHVRAHVRQRLRVGGMLDQREAAELAHVAVVDGVAVEVEGHVDMPVWLVVRLGQELAGHPQVDHQVGSAAVVGAEAGDQVLAAPMQPGQRAAEQRGTHGFRRGLQQSAPAHAHPGQPAAGQFGGQRAADAFDFGELGHQRPLVTKALLLP